MEKTTRLGLQFFAEPETPPQPEQTNNPSGDNIDPEKKEQPTIISRTLEEDIQKFKGENIKGKQSVYAKLGVKTEEEFEAKLAIIKAHEEKVAKEEEDKPEIERLRGENALLPKYKGDLDAANKKIAEYEQKNAVRNAKVDDKFAEYVAYEANKLVTEEVDFATALTEYLKNNPEYLTKEKEFNPNPNKLEPDKMFPGQGDATPIEADLIKAQFKKAQSLNNMPEMVRLTRLANKKNIKLY